MRPRRTATRATALLAGLALAACDPATTRPRFLPTPEAPSAPVALTVPAATQQLADALRGDSVPLGRVVPRDGYIESPWFDARSNRPSTRQAPGPELVRVRAWVDPIDRRHSQLTVESVYRESVDPSLPPRELERALPPGHPLAQRMQHTLDSLSGKLEAARRTAQAARDSSARADSLRAAAAAATRDSLRGDSTRTDSTRRDSTAAPKGAPAGAPPSRQSRPAAPTTPAPRPPSRDTLPVPPDSTRPHRAAPTSSTAPR